MPIFMKYGSIEGGATASGLKGWIELDSFSWGVTNPPSSSGTGSGKLSVSDITIGKVVDQASVPLLKQLVGGQPTKGVMIKFYKSVKLSQAEYLQYTLENTLVSSYLVNSALGSDSVPPSESITLNFARVEIQYTKQTPIVIAAPPLG